MTIHPSIYYIYHIYPSSDGEKDVGKLDETIAPGLYDCGYSGAFDNIGTKKLKSTVWSWDRSKPTM